MVNTCAKQAARNSRPVYRLEQAGELGGVAWLWLAHLKIDEFGPAPIRDHALRKLAAKLASGACPDFRR